MSFDILRVTAKVRINNGLACTKESCGCDTCPLQKFCDGPSIRCDAKNCTKQCIACRANCNRMEGRDRVVASIGGGDFSHVKWEPWAVDLPPILHQINYKLRGIDLPGVVINAKRLFYTETQKWSPQKDLRKRFNIPETSPVGISFFTDDNWMDSWADQIPVVADEVAKFKPDFVFGMDFSNYDNYPRFDTIVNMKRRMESIRLLQSRGLRVIPSLGWCTERDFQRMKDWCIENKPTYVACNLQTIRIPTYNPAWRERMRRYVEFRNALPDTHIVILGGSAPKRMASLIEHLAPNIHFLDAKAFRHAEFHKDMDGNVDKTITVHEQFKANVDFALDHYWTCMGACNSERRQYQQTLLSLGD